MCAEIMRLNDKILKIIPLRSVRFKNCAKFRIVTGIPELKFDVTTKNQENRHRDTGSARISESVWRNENESSKSKEADLTHLMYAYNTMMHTSEEGHIIEAREARNSA